MTTIVDQFVRPATIDDLQAVERFAELLARQDNTDPNIPDIAHVFVAERGEAIVGMAAMCRNSPGTAQLSHLYVKENARRCGIGTALVHVTTAVLPLGTLLELLVPTKNIGAQLFYKAIGFEPSEFCQLQMVTAA